MPDDYQDWHVKVRRIHTNSKWWPFQHYWIWKATPIAGMNIRREGDVYFTKCGAKYAAKRDLRRMFVRPARKDRLIEFDVHL